MTASSKDCVLAIDLGTSGPKVAVVRVDAEVLGWETRRTQLRLSDGGGAEQDPEDWWRTITEASRAVLEATGMSGGTGAGGRVVAVSVTAQWAGTVAVDAEGKALHPAITWMDSRGARYMADFCGGLVRIEGYGAAKLWRWIRTTGGAPSLVGKEPTAHLLWLRHNAPEVYAKATHFLEPKDWVNRRLTGRATATTDSICLHWITDNRDISAIDYDPVLLDRLGVPRAKLPELVAATDVVGPLLPEAAEALGLGPLVSGPGGSEVHVMGGTPDVHSAAVGSGATGDGELHLYVGTSSWLSGHLRQKKIDLFHNMATLPSALPGRYLIGDSQETAGACFEHLRDQLLFADDGLTGPVPEDFWAQVEALARAAPVGSGGLIYTPWLYGERCPTPDHTIRAGFHNLSLASTRKELLRSVYEGVALNTRWLLKYVERFVGRPAPSIRFIGGGASSGLWCQIMADVLDRDIEQVADPRACNARGAALLASLGLGYLEVEDIPGRVAVAQRYSPRPENRETYASLFAEFSQIYAKNKAIHRRLNTRA